MQPLLQGEAPCPPQVGLAGGRVSAISELLIGFTATALTTPLLPLTSCLNHHSNSSERCDLLFKTHSQWLFLIPWLDVLLSEGGCVAGGAQSLHRGSTQGHSAEGGRRKNLPLTLQVKGCR